jgi:serine/threonine-protein kinase
VSGTFGKYEVVELIGQGGFGQVFRGRDPVLKRDVAIKTVSLVAPLARERFLREAEIAAGLRHPNIVSIYDYGEQDGVPYLVQEFLPGEDLSHRIQRRDTGDVATRIDWLIAVAEALQFAHRQGIVHRDVKPSNVRLVQDGSVRLVDFGIAKVLDSEQQLTGTNQSLGTSGYLAPEQLAGSEIDHRADIFSFGVLAYELLTCEKPFAAETVQATLYRILTADPTPLASLAPDVPHALAACVERCLRKSPDERYPDFAPLIDELRRIRHQPDATPVTARGVAPVAAGTAGPAARPTATSVLSPDAARPRAGTPAAPAEPVAPAPSSNRIQKIGIAGVAIVALAAVVWGGTVALSAMLGGRDRVVPPIAADSLVRDTATVAAADSATEPDSAAGAGADASESGAGADDPIIVAQTGTVTPADTGTGGAAGVDAGDVPPAGDLTGRVAIDPARVLVVIGGEPGSAVETVESTVLAELLAEDRPFVDPAVLAGIRADAAAMRALESGASPAVEVGREYGAGTVVVGELVVDASEAVAGLITGTAVLTARYYDTGTGRLILSETYQIGAGGVPGKAGVTVTDAVTQAAESVARQMSRAILQKTGS